MVLLINFSPLSLIRRILGRSWLCYQLSSSSSSIVTAESMGINSKITLKNKVEGFDRKSVSSSSSFYHLRMSFFGFKSILWFFLGISLLYFLFSLNFLNPDRHDCLKLLSDPLTEELLQSLANITSRIQPRRQEQEEEIVMEEEGDQKYLLPQKSQRYDTKLKHVVFGIAASSNLWEKRKEYITQWWRPKETRGIVWLDKKVRINVNERLPEIRISGDTSKFNYTNRQGQRSALRISRVVSETLRLGLKDVRWFVMGDDDTVFVVDNVVRILSKYDHRQFYYVGSSSESHVQNIYFSYAMAYGGGGFAISYPLAKELEKMQDRCIHRYSSLYGSDDRIQACMAELGVPLTREPGFHQYDVYGDLLGLLGAHPVTPLLSLHHLDVVEPIFPRMTRVKAVQRLFQSIKLDSASTMQQSICYDTRRLWSISVSWGFVVQILRGIISPRELEMPTRTFLNWYRKADYTAYSFNTRPVSIHPCETPSAFYLSGSKYDQSRKQTVGVYSRHRSRQAGCGWEVDSPEKMDSVVVFKKPDPNRWQKSPRRDCCRILPSRRSSTMYLWVGYCRDGEISQL